MAAPNAVAAPARTWAFSTCAVLAAALSALLCGYAPNQETRSPSTGDCASAVVVDDTASLLQHAVEVLPNHGGLRSAHGGSAHQAAAEGAAVQQQRDEGRKKPNVVFILADDLGSGDLKVFAGENNTIIETPAIDRLAEGGMLLKKYYAQPLCTPTRAAIHTGRYPIRYGLQHLVIKPTAPFSLATDEPTLPQAFKAAGYSTHAVGKWHLGHNTWNATPSFRGYNTWVGYYNDEVGPFDQYRDGFYDWHRQRRPNCGQDCTETDWSAKGVYNTHIITDEAVKIISDRSRDGTPFFLYVAYENLHEPCEVLEGYVEPYKEKVQDRTRQRYAGMVAALDEGVGKITAALEESGMLDDTIIVFGSDNGGPLAIPRNGTLATIVSIENTAAGGGKDMAAGGGKDMDRVLVSCGDGSWNQDTGATNFPLRGSKGSLYEGGVRVPGIVHYPRKIKAGSTFDGPFHVSDWFPTLLSAAGVPDVAERSNFPLDGVSQWRALTTSNAEAFEDRIILLNTDRFQLGGAVVQGRYKYYFGGQLVPGIWQFPPEVAAARGWKQDDTLEGDPIWCPSGCMVDLKKDPREIYPFTPSATDRPELVSRLEEVRAVYNEFVEEAAFPLFVQVLLNPQMEKAQTEKAHAVAEAHGGVWTPYM